MVGALRGRSSATLCGLLFIALIMSVSIPGTAGDPHSAYYGTENDSLIWFIQTSDTHIGASDTASNNLSWLVTQALPVIEPSFIMITGDLTDSTNDNWLGLPNGPYQAEWDEYKSIVDASVTLTNYYDIPGNHDAYNDRYFAYYLANSVQGRATGRTQVSFEKSIGLKKYHFLGVNTADNTGDAFSLFWPYGDYAGLDTSELSFIGSEMNAHPDAELTLVFGHHPLQSTGDSSDTYVYYGLPQFLSLMDDSYSPLYGYGHTHDFSEAFFIPDGATHEGFFYFNVNSLGKSSENQYTVMAIDCNGISSKTLTMNTWPAVLITAPVDTKLGGYNPYAYSVPASVSNPIRALVFDRYAVTSVQYRIDGGTQWFVMTRDSENSHLYQALWNASSLAEGSHTIEVKATSVSGTRSDIITARIATAAQTPTIGVTSIQTGKYVTTGTKKTKVTTFVLGSTFIQGDSIVFRLELKDSSGKAVSGATVQLGVAGPSSTTLTSAPSNSSGIAEASWQTSAPNKRGTGGTAYGSYEAMVTGMVAPGFDWDGIPQKSLFTILVK